jgi:hypothetical protein
MFAVKADAPLNMLAMFETDATFHLLMSLLNVVLPENSWYMLLTPYVTQATMSPYVVVAVVEFVTHAVAAVPMLLSVRHVNEQLAPHKVAHVG